MREVFGRRTGHYSGVRRRALRPRLEEMESRVLPSVSASLLKDLNLQPASSNPAGFLTIGAITYFSADDGVHGRELWRTNGTTAGTFMVKDINPNGGSDPTDLVALNGKLLFQAGIYHEQLWVSDGTTAGTKLLRDFNPARPAVASVGILTPLGTVAVFTALNATSGNHAIWRTDGSATGTWLIKDIDLADGFTVVNGIAFFAGSDATDGVELWKTNGKIAGTVRVLDINSGPADSDPFDLAAAGNLLFFVANDGVHGREPWRSDGTAAGTFMTHDILPGSGSSIRDQPYQGYPDVFTAAGSQVFFNANDGADGTALWVSDGTAAGTHIVIGAAPGSTPEYAGLVTASGNAIYYSVPPSGSGNLWRSDGTAPGTYLVSNVDYYAGLGTVNGLFIFLGDTDGFHSTELWATDGTSTGTVQLQQIAVGSPNLFVPTQAQPYIIWGSNVYVAVFGPTTGLGFWKTDGTPAGTSELSSATVGKLISSGDQIVLANGLLLFAATDAQNDTELWASDGTSAGTARVRDINTGTLGSSDDLRYDKFVGMNGAIYFTTYDTVGDIGGQLWKTNGSAAGTTLVTQLPYPGASDLTVVGNSMFYVTESGDSQIWKSDGTAAGTVVVTDANSKSQPYQPNDLTAFNGTLYFLSGGELWKSDVTTSGTVVVAQFGTGGSPPISVFGSLAVSHNLLYFLVEDSDTNSLQLWESNGTTAGTTLVQALGLNVANTPHNLFVMNGQLYYSSDADGQGWQLWKTNGTVAGTKLVKVLTPGAVAYPTNFTNVNGVLYFTADDGTGGAALWRSDGTTAGTTELADFSFPRSLPSDLTNVNGVLFFDTGTELWKSDGTPGGTVRVAVILNGPRGYGLSDLTVLDGLLFFSGDDGLHGPSLWESDGTAAGTFMVPGIRKEGASAPGALTVLWNRLFFIADDGIHGFEPWTIRVSTTPEIASVLSVVSSGAPRTSLAPALVTVSPSPNPSQSAGESNMPLEPAKLTVAAHSRLATHLSRADADSLFSLNWDERLL